MKSYTDIEQSKKLTEFLPIESADMRYSPLGDNMHPWIWTDTFIEKDAIPCWSLAALLRLMPKIQGGKPIIALDDNYITYPLTYRSDLHTKVDNLVDACFEMIIKLHEQNLL